MIAIDLPGWVAAEPDPGRQRLRQAMHLILRAVANSPELAPLMVMKGGVLLAIRYHSPRFTKDIDFSTRRKLQDVEVPSFVAALDQALVGVSADNEYGLSLRVQSQEIDPANRPDASFPTLQIKVGYALKSDTRQIARLSAKQAANAVRIDYSFNEWATELEHQSIEGGELVMYAFHDLIAEKLRSVLQQPLRKRKRFQDIYDLCLLIGGTTFTADDKASILQKLFEAGDEREVRIHRGGMRDPDVERMSKEGYFESLEALIGPSLPDFDTSYAIVTSFYEGLPWAH